MKVALLSYEYPPDTGFGGIGTYTWYQARALVRLGHEVHVVAGATEPGTSHSEHDGVRVTRVAGRELLPGAVEGLAARGAPWAANRLATAQAAFGAIRDLADREQFDVVEHPECGADGMFLATLSGLRSCVRFHSPARFIMPIYGASAADVEAASLLEQVAVAGADVRTSPSAFLAAEVVTKLGVEPPVHVVANGLDLAAVDEVDKIDAGEQFGLPSAPAVTVVTSGRLERRKGAHLLADICIPVLARWPHVHFVLAGADTEGLMATSIRPRVEAAGFGDRLHHLGRRSLEEVRAVLDHADIYLHPTMWDNAPYACLEAMGARLPIVASDCGGLPELIEDGRSGLLARTGDAAAFVTGLERLIEDPRWRERLGAEARRAVEERYSDVAMARRTVEIWEQHLLT